jgi:hypothetical protein
MKKVAAILTLALAATVLLAACGSTPVPALWQSNAFSALKAYSAAYLDGNNALARSELAAVRAEISKTGRADLLARAELVVCALQVASLEFDGCAPYQALASEADAGERAYASYLAGNWGDIKLELLPAQHRALVLHTLSQSAAAGPAGGPSGGPSASMLGAMEDPLSRLVGAGALLQSGHLGSSDIEIATQTASSQGWRRPLLAWLGLQRQRALLAGDTQAAARLQRRMDLVAPAATSTAPEH